VFTWQPTSETSSYEIYLHNGEVGILQTGITNLTWTPATDLPAGEWTWSIRPQTTSGPGAWSAPRSFNTSGQTRITRPLDTTTDTRPLFRWLTVAGATRYIIQVDNLTTGATSVIRENNLTDTTFLPATDLTLGSYRVWIRALNSNSAGLWSRQVDFEIVARNQPESDSGSGLDGLNLQSLLTVLPQPDVTQIPPAAIAVSHEVRGTERPDEATLAVEDPESSGADGDLLLVTDELMSALGSDSDWLYAPRGLN
jgi:hypothetical protein